MNDEGPTRGRGVQSVEVSVGLLSALAAHPGPMTLSELAAAVGMAPAKVHRYMASFVGTGMVEHRRSGTYDLGPGAARIGVAAIARIDPVNRAANALPDLVEQTGLNALLAVWGNGGATVVRWEKAARPLITMLGLGSVLSLTRSATGHAFMAHLPDRMIASALAVEAPGTTLADMARTRESVRVDGVATADQAFIPGLCALAAPVLDARGECAAVVTLVGTEDAMLRPDHPARAALLTITRAGR